MSALIEPRADTAPTILEQLSDAFVQVVERVAPAVVNVRTDHGGGSGVVIAPDGYVLTNAHVVAESRSVRLVHRDGRETSADLIGSDASTDLAVVRSRQSGLDHVARPHARLARGALAVYLNATLQLADGGGRRRAG